MESIDASASAAPLLAGRYRLLEVIGRGGMAEVHRAADVKLDRQVAVKLLLDAAGDSDDRARFIAEARTLARLSHSGLVTVFDAGFGARAPGAQGSLTGGDQPFLVMELVDGPTLAELMSAGPLPLEEVGVIGVQVAEALAYVHAHGVVHRDIKPGNVLSGRERRVKLADFGIARLLEQATRHTRTGQAIGTAAYLAPEQVRGGEVGGAADIYSLGLVLLEALTGRREYPGSATESALARLSRPPRVPSDLPEAWGQLLATMTDDDPRRRPTAVAVASTLRAGLADRAPVATEGEPDAATAPILAAEEPVAPTRPLTVPPGPPPPPPTGPPPNSPPPTSPPPTAPPPTSPPPTTPPPTAPPHAGPSSEPPARRAKVDAWRRRLAERAGSLSERLRRTPSDVRGAAAAIAAIVLLLVIMAIAADDSSRPAIPDNTPERLQEPLEDLHVAVNGDEE